MNQVRANAGKGIGRQERRIRRLPLLLSMALLVLFLSAVYLHFAYQRYQGYARDEAANLVATAEMLLNQQIKSQLWQNPVSTASPGYQAFKRTLMLFRAENSQIRFAYVIYKENGKYYFFVDSEPANSEEFSPYGQEFTEATDSVRKVFELERTIVSSSEADRWGTWVTALTPVNNAGGQMLAAFGIDYPADQWQAGILRRMTPEIIIVCSVALLLMALCWVVLERMRLAALSRRLADDEELFRTVVEQAPVGIVIGAPGTELFSETLDRDSTNRMFLSILGRAKADLAGLRWQDITHPDDLASTQENHRLLNVGKIDGFTMEKRYLRPDGTQVWANTKVVNMSRGSGKLYALALIEDITLRRQAEQARQESERSKAVLLSHLPGLAYRCLPDRE